MKTIISKSNSSYNKFLSKSQGNFADRSSDNFEKKIIPTEVSIGKRPFGKNYHALVKAVEESENSNPPVIFNLRRGQYGTVVGEQGSAKTTLITWIAHHLACGKAYEPFCNESEPIKVYILDGESMKEELKEDLPEFRKHFSDDELKLIDENLIWACQETVEDKLLQLTNQEHLEFLTKELLEFKPDLIIADNLTSMFEGLIENDNPSMNSKVILPMRELGRKVNAAVLLVHHTGKYSEEYNPQGAMSSRGASNLPNMARNVLLLQKTSEVDGKLVIRASMAKEKGFKMSAVTLTLEGDERNFKIGNGSLSTNSKTVTAQSALLSFFENKHEQELETEAIQDALQQKGFKERTIRKAIETAVENNDLVKVRHGVYKTAKSTNGINGSENKIVAVSYSVTEKQDEIEANGINGKTIPTAENAVSEEENFIEAKNGNLKNDCLSANSISSSDYEQSLPIKIEKSNSYINYDFDSVRQENEDKQLVNRDELKNQNIKIKGCFGESIDYAQTPEVSDFNKGEVFPNEANAFVFETKKQDSTNNIMKEIINGKYQTSNFSVDELERTHNEIFNQESNPTLHERHGFQLICYRPIFDDGENLLGYKLNRVGLHENERRKKLGKKPYEETISTELFQWLLRHQRIDALALAA